LSQINNGSGVFEETFMNANLDGKVAIVTGGGRDIGRASAIKLAQNGASVAVNYLHSADKANETVATIQGSNGKAVAIRADITNEGEVEQLVHQTQEAFGQAIHVLVNNAGGLVARRPLLEMDNAFLNEVMQLNLNSVFLMMKAVVPKMTEGGSIVNLSSLAARNGGGGGAVAYATAKGAVLTFTRGMSKELALKGVRVNCVSPGLIGTGFHDKFTSDEVRKNVAASTPISREGRAEEVADVVVFLAGDTSTYITGESIEINGGAYFI